MKRLFSLAIILFLTSVSIAQKKDLNYYYAQAPFKMPVVAVPNFPDKVFAITDFGAVSDGHTLNTLAFTKAIDACNKAGGGKVLVPSGSWLTGPIEMKSNVNLVVEAGALIQFTKDHTQYPIIKGSAASPIYGYDLSNIAITGNGVIDGAGDSWRPLKKEKATEKQWKEFNATGVLSRDAKIWWPSKEALEGEDYIKKLKESKPKPSDEELLPARDFLRPYMVMFSKCDKVLIEGVTIRNSPKFIFYPTKCTNVTLKNANFFNEWWAQNGDAIDISACKNVLIYQCNVSAGDDGICMKSSGGKGGETEESALENVLIAGCNVYHAHGGFVIGSNTDGGMKNIFVTDCNFVGTDIGIRIKSNAGRGGYVRDIYVFNIFMKDIVNEAINFDTYYEDVPPGKSKEEVKTVLRDKTPVFKGFYLKNITCTGASTAISITGLPELPVSNINLENVTISAKEGYVNKNATNINFKKVTIITPKETKQW
jgi:DNA sulfur modification protein DndE